MDTRQFGASAPSQACGPGEIEYASWVPQLRREPSAAAEIEFASWMSTLREMVLRTCAERAEVEHTGVKS